MTSQRVQFSCSVFLCMDIKVGLFVLISMYILFPHLWTLAILFFPSGMVYSKFLPIEILLILFFFFFLKSLGLFSLQQTGMIQRSVLGRNTERASMHGLSGWPTPRLTQWDAVSGSQILNSRNFVSLLARVAISPKKNKPCADKTPQKLFLWTRMPVYQFMMNDMLSMALLLHSKITVKQNQ